MAFRERQLEKGPETMFYGRNRKDFHSGLPHASACKRSTDIDAFNPSSYTETGRVVLSPIVNNYFSQMILGQFPSW